MGPLGFWRSCWEEDGESLGHSTLAFHSPRCRSRDPAPDTIPSLLSNLGLSLPICSVSCICLHSWKFPVLLNLFLLSLTHVSGLNLNVAYSPELCLSNTLLKHTVLLPHTSYRDGPKTEKLACGFIYQCLSPGLTSKT